jgi:hypothetical protein
VGEKYIPILCGKCPKVVDYEEDNWCSDRCLPKNYMRKTYPNTPLSEFRAVIPMFTPMDSYLSWTMRKRKKMRRSEDFLVYLIYND